MKWLIYGGQGWIGTQFISKLEDHSVVVARSRADNVCDVKDEIERVKPDVVFSFVGRTHGVGHSTIDYLEQSGKVLENVRDNLFAPIALAEICRQQNVYFVYLGTGCIFESEDSVPFDEDAEPNFFGSSYSVVKGFTDRLFHLLSCGKNSLNVRIRMPITGRPNVRNFVTKITNYSKVVNVQNSMTVLPSLFDSLIELIEKKTVGTINLTNPGTISHNEILDMYTDIVDNSFTYKNFTISEQDLILKSKRSNNELDTSKLERLCPNVPDIKTAIKDCLLEYKKYAIKETILVTGGCGFIGSNFVKYIYDTYPLTHIINVDLLTYSGDEKNVEQYIKTDTYRYSFYNVDICDSNAISNILETRTINTIVHFAAETHVDRSFNSSLNFTRTNVLGTHTLLQELLNVKHKKIKFIHISTDEVYGGENSEQVLETNKMNPTNPYSATKAGAESLVNSYQRSFGLPCVIVRCNNVYGPRQYPEKLIPKFILFGLQGMPMTIHGEGRTKRSFIYISDVVKAVDTVMQKGELHSIYNIGVESEFSVNDVAIMISNELKLKTVSTLATPDRVFNDNRYYINSDKLKTLGWKQEIEFASGLSKTVEWYRKHQEDWLEKFLKST